MGSPVVGEVTLRNVQKPEQHNTWFVKLPFHEKNKIILKKQHMRNTFLPLGKTSSSFVFKSSNDELHDFYCPRRHKIKAPVRFIMFDISLLYTDER